MSALDIVPVDPAGPSYDDYYGVYAAALRHSEVGELVPVWQHGEVRAQLADPTPRRVRRAWLGVDDGRPVATGWLEASTVDNPDLADVLVCVAPDARGRGHGAALLAHVEAAARELGRSRLLALLDWPYDDPDGSGFADLQWARRHGFEVGLVEVQRRLALPVDPATLDRLADDAAPHHAAYSLRTFVGRVPDDLAAGWVALTSTLMTEAPSGDIEREVQNADVAGLREREALIAQEGRTKFGTAALTADGEVVAYSDLTVSVHEPDRAYQWGTLVRTDHRGHRLGMAVKLVNVRLLQEHRPEVGTVITYNAEVNDHMIGVNAAMGFVPVLRGGELQKRL